MVFRGVAVSPIKGLTPKGDDDRCQPGPSIKSRKTGLSASTVVVISMSDGIRWFVALA
jgi:hypothetical protein